MISSASASAVHKSLAYRRDLDGIRGVAVIVGTLFHIFPANTFPSGYACADVFFVLSGFLISSIIFKKLDKNSFSFKEFYAYRINRIFPSLLILLYVMLIVSWFTFFSQELLSISEHFSSGAFLSNYVFATESGYFHASSEYKPFLHLWSIALEEQFYLFFPVFLWGVYKSRLNREMILLVLIMITFSLNLYFTPKDPIASYYLPHTRIWPLLCGGFLASVLPRLQTSRWLNEYPRTWDVISVISLVTILLASIFIPITEPYPGILGLIPTVAAVLLIAAKPTSLANRTILSHSSLVFFGLISFPCYLWHYAILAFGNIYEGGPASTEFRFGTIVASVVLGWLSYKFIELPNRLSGPGRWKPLVFVGALLVIVAAGWAIRLEHGVPSRAIAVKGRAITAAKEDWDWPSTKFANGKIVFGPHHFFEGQTQDKVLFIGDSLMGQYYPRVKLLYERNPKPQLSTVFAARFSCVPAPIPDLICEDDFIRCIDYYHAALELARAPDVKTVVFSGDWGRKVPHPSMLTQFFTDVSELTKLNKKVFFIAPSPLSHSISPQAASKYVRFSESADVSKAVPRKAVEDFVLLKQLNEGARTSGATVINPLDNLCFKDMCPYMIKGEPVYKDEEHLRRQTVLRKWKPLDFIDRMLEP